MRPSWRNHPFRPGTGGFIAPGHDDDLDAARKLRDEGRGVIATLQADYITDTGVQSLKIKHNNVLGYFIETTATHAQKMLSPPLSERFIHRQTTANAVRFTTLDLSDLETRILNAGTRALEIEMALFRRLREVVLEEKRPHRVRRRARWRSLTCRARLPRAPAKATGAAPRSTTTAGSISWPDVIRWWSQHFPGPVRPSSRMTAPSIPRATALPSRC